MRRGLLTLLLVLLCLPAWAEMIGMVAPGGDTPISFSADNLRNVSPTKVEASGNVLVEWDGRSMKADSLTYDRGEGLIEAEGNVELLDKQGNRVSCSAATLDVVNMTGWLLDTEIYLPEMGYLVKAATLERTGPNTYEAQDAEFSACDGTWPAWRVEAAWLEVELNGYLYGTGALFWMESAPLAWLPVFVFPAKIDRQSGFLTPSAGVSDKDGFIISQRYYWVISESADAIIEADYRSRKGWAEQVTLRYLLDEDQGGRIKLRHYANRQGPDNQFDLLVDHLGNSSGSTVLDVLVDITGDEEARVDYEDDLKERGISRVESHLYLAKNTEPGAFYLHGRYTDVFSAGQQQDEVLQLLPSAGLTGTDLHLAGPLYSRTDAAAARLWRQNGVWADRLTMSQGVLTQWNPWGLGVGIEGGYRQNLYNLHEDDDNDPGRARGAGWAEAMLNTSLQRHFGDRLHMVEPYARYRWEEEGRGADTPYFDDKDLFDHSSLLTLGLESRLYGLNEFFLFDVERTVDIGMASRSGWEARVWSPWRFETAIGATEYLKISADGDFDPDVTGSWLRWAYDVNLSDQRGDRLWWQHQYVSGEANYWKAGAHLKVYGGWAATYQNRYSRRDRRVLEDRAGLTYTHQCWELDSAFSRTYIEEDHDYERKVMVSFTLKGLGRTGSASW